MQGWFNIQQPMNVILHINRPKKKNHMIISIDAIKAFDKIEHLFIIKSCNKLEMEGKFLNLKKGIYQNSIANSIFNGEN